MTVKTYYCGFFKNRPHMSIINDGFSDLGTGVFLFKSKKYANIAGYEEVRKVQILVVE